MNNHYLFCLQGKAKTLFYSETRVRVTAMGVHKNSKIMDRPGDCSLYYRLFIRDVLKKFCPLGASTLPRLWETFNLSFQYQQSKRENKPYGEFFSLNFYICFATFPQVIKKDYIY